jgi:hypothetical protein
MKILMVLTSHDQLGNTGRTTGFWLEEFAAPYFVFRDADVQLTLASPKGGQPPIDPKSDLPENQTPAMARFKQDQAAQKALSQTAKPVSARRKYAKARNAVDQCAAIAVEIQDERVSVPWRKMPGDEHLAVIRHEAQLFDAA